jgi:hypothetical protein
MKTLLLQAVGGIAGGLALVIPSAPIGFWFGTGSGEMFAQANAILFGVVGYTIGVPMGIEIASRRVRAWGSLWRGLVGSMVGSGLFCAGARIFSPEGGGYTAWPALLQFVVAMLPPLIVGMFGYNFVPSGDKRGTRRG